MSPHLEFKKEDIAKTVIMPGDPLRAKYIAETFLEDAKLINRVRNILGYTGYYKGKMVSVIASGMGIPSMGIYSYELFKIYDVENIIRIGTCGAYKDLHLKDLILVENSCSNSTYRYLADNKNEKIVESSIKINNIIEDVAKNNGIIITKGNIYCSDVFYNNTKNYEEIVSKYSCLGVEMETFSLFHNAKMLNKQASCILTVSDTFINKDELSREEREKSLNIMIKLALDSALKL